MVIRVPVNNRSWSLETAMEIFSNGRRGPVFSSLQSTNHKCRLRGYEPHEDSCTGEQNQAGSFWNVDFWTTLGWGLDNSGEEIWKALKDHQSTGGEFPQCKSNKDSRIINCNQYLTHYIYFCKRSETVMTR